MSPNPGPIVGRLKRPGWTDPRLLIGMVLIAIAVVATSSIVANADTTEAVLAARGTLTPGTVLTEANVVVVHVRVGENYIPADDAPWGQVVTRVVGPGELVPAEALADPEDFDSRPVAVMATVPLAEGIERGAVVDVWVTSEGAFGPDSILVAGGLVVDQVDRGSGAFASGGTETVYVIVEAHDVGDFLAALNGQDAVAVVASAGSPTS